MRNDYLKYRAEIDGLRALAVVPVILFHAGVETFRGGFVGVDVFFVISGYLITTIIFDEIATEQFSLVSFYERRVRRLFPALYVVSASTTAASLFLLYPAQLKSFARSLISAPLFFANFHFWSERGYFGEASELKPLLHLWSLAVEEQFYIVFPLLLLLISRSKKSSYSLLFAGFLLSLTSSYYVTEIHFETAFFFPVTRAWELLVGSLAAILMREGLYLRWTLASEAVSIIGLSLILFSYLEFDHTTAFPGVNATIPVCGTFLFILAGASSRWARHALSLKPIVFVGLLSYSLYLWHQPIFSLSRHLGLFESNILLLLSLIGALSFFTFKFVETPFRNPKTISRRKVFGASMAGGLFLVGCGAFILSRDGLPNRYSIEDRVLLTQLANVSGYNQAAFDSHEEKLFDLSEQRRVVVVGDSYAKDLFNIVLESGMFADVQWSTKQINAECGNLYLEDYEVLERFIPDNRLARCRAQGWYNGDRFRAILGSSDELWLASDWKPWVVEFIPESISKLARDYGVTVRIFGTKNFGSISVDSLLKVEEQERWNYTQEVTQDSVSIDSGMAKALITYELYYPLLSVLCGGSYSECRVFTGDGLLVSADGGHLTREGAIEAGMRMQDVLKDLALALS